MSISSKLFRTTTCPNCKHKNKTVYWAGDANAYRSAFFQQGLVRCKHCREDYHSDEAIYFYDTTDDYVLSLCLENNLDTKESLGLDEGAELNVVSNPDDFVSVLIARTYGLNWKVVLILLRDVAFQFMTGSVKVETRLYEETGRKLDVRVKVVRKSENAIELLPFDMSLYLDIFDRMKNIIDWESSSFTDEEIQKAYDAYKIEWLFN